MEVTWHGPGVYAWECRCVQRIVCRAQAVQTHSVDRRGNVHSGECAHGGVYMRHPVACEHTTHLLTTSTFHVMQAQAKSDT